MCRKYRVAKLLNFSRMHTDVHAFFFISNTNGRNKEPSFSKVDLRNSVVNYRKSVDLDPIELFLMNKISVYSIFSLGNLAIKTQCLMDSKTRKATLGPVKETGLTSTVVNGSESTW